MTIALTDRTHPIRYRLGLARWRWRVRRRRLVNAWRYAFHRLDERIAGDIIFDCQPVAGWWPLETFGIEGISEAARYRWSNSAEEIEPFIRQACERVASKWDSTGDIPSAAEEWAMDLIAEYAAQEGIELVEGEREEGEGR